MEVVRAFIAVELPEPIKEALRQLLRMLEPKKHSYVKWVDPNSIHLTLKFLGNVSVDRLPEITDAMSRAAKGIKPFQLQLGNLGAFPNQHNPRVAWVGLGGEIPSLLELQRKIDHALVPLSFPKEDRPFSPHLTLGRVRENSSPQERRQLGELLASLKMEASASFQVGSLSLMRSELTPKGAIYTRLASATLE